jgi:hypothetical protein
MKTETYFEENMEYDTIDGGQIVRNCQITAINNTGPKGTSVPDRISEHPLD